MANLAVPCPLRELDFADQFRFPPMRVASQRPGGRRRERTRLLLDALEPGAQLERELLRESGSHLAAEHQAIAVVVPNQQRPNSRPHPIRIGKAANDEFLALHAFGFHPAAMPSRAVWQIAPLRHNPFESRAARL